MGRKYLEDEGYRPVGGDCDPEDERQTTWEQELETYGFDSRETWSLDYAMVTNLFERVRMFQEVAPKVVDLTFHKFTWEGVEYTQEEIIEVLLDLCRAYFQADDTFGADVSMTKNIWLLWSEISPAMWW